MAAKTDNMNQLRIEVGNAAVRIQSIQLWIREADGKLNKVEQAKIDFENLRQQAEAASRFIQKAVRIVQDKI
ncbi:hypothetical protein HY640_01165 [Candidatus Woesearchaeota archaeon]|nr:hypothetical protein [Candidatus Woesearchaeota archaeon]